MPALGVPSPHIYFKPLAQSLDESFNIVIVEPFGYGLSDVAATDRTVDNINSELNAALDTMGIKQCVLLVHSISGVYGLNFVQNYPEKVKGFIKTGGVTVSGGEPLMQAKFVLELFKKCKDN